MPETGVQHDLDSLTLTIVAEFAAPPARIWQVYADPRQLEKVWGPPTYPATVVDHDLTPGGRTTYVMTGPEGDKHAGYWQITAVDEPKGFAFEDGFAHLDFTPNTSQSSPRRGCLPVKVGCPEPAYANERHFHPTWLDESAVRSGSVSPALPASRNVYRFAAHGGGTRATYVSTYANAEALQQVLAMGIVEGASGAIGQIDELIVS